MDVMTLLDTMEAEKRRVDDRYFQLEDEYRKAREQRDENSAAALCYRAYAAWNRGTELERAIKIVKEFIKKGP